jgi:hypothetical protein
MVGVTGSIPVVPTTNTPRLYRVGDTRISAVVSKTCLPNFLVRAVSAPAIEPNEPISPTGLCSKKFRSWRARRLYRVFTP